jgi:glucan-binding YG repeat protein
VGGIVGISGDQSKLEETPTISSSTNSSDLNFNISGAGGKDRFGADLYAHSQAVGGIVGYSMGNIDSCVNEGIIYTGVKSSINMDTTTTTIKKPVAGFGAGATGGIVGSLRGNLFDDLSNSDTSTVGNPPYNYYRDKGGKSAGATATPPTVKITDCTNKGIVIGLSGVGGIIGSSTGWSEIEGCANKGDVMGTRWNKPFSGGIGGTVQSDIRYCYNRGDIYSTAGAGYYCAGISGGFESDNTTSTEGNERVAEPLLTGCYTTGQIYLDAAGYRSGILVGENTGIIQNNAFIPDITPDGKIVDTNSGTVTDTIETSEFVKEDLKSSKGIARLNTYAAGKGMWEMIYVEDIGNTNDGYPVLVRAGGDDSKMHLAGATILGGVAVLFEDAKYSTTIDPVPSVSIDSLHQNADYYVVPQEGTNGNDVSSTTYSASVIGMGKYKDTLTSSLSYKIKAAPIEECTIYADPVIFNWNIQRPSEDKVTLYDPSGGVVDSENYLVSDTYDASKGEKGYDIDPSPTHVEIAYYDYKNAHDRYWYYNIVVTAKGGANYEGTSTQKAWRIKSASMIPQRPESDPQYNPLSPESVVYGKTYFDINQNGNIEENEKFDTLKGTDDKTGDAIKIPYTGSVIYPRVESLTFKNILLREATNFDYIANPTSFDYKYVYGNPNPEIDDGKNAQPINVSKPGKPETMTIRFTSGSNFENYNNVFYQIVPADISLVSAGSIPAQAYTGNAISPSLSLKYNGITLKKGTDYTVTYSNNIKSGSSAKAVITGTGNFTGSKTILFKINPPKVGWQLISGKWYYNNSSGVALKGWLYDGGKWYLLHKTTGHMLSGWQQDGSIWYLLHNTSGHMLTGWQYDGSNWYYLASSGAMKTGWYYDGSNWYYLASSGAMKTGWHYDGSNWYYLDSSGAMRTGWLQISNKWYYLNSSGAMVTGTQKIGSKKYKFNSSGVWVK